MFFWMSNNFFLPILPLYYHTLGMSDHQIGIAIGAFSIGAVLFRVFCGKLADRYGSKPILSVGIVLSTLAIINYYYSTTIMSATVSRFLHGVGISVYSGASLTMATFMHDQQHMTEAVAIYTLFTMLGVGVAAGSASWLYSIGDFRLVVAAGAIATILSFVLFPKNPILKTRPAAGQPLPLIKVIGDPGVYIPTVTLLAINMCFASMMTFLPLLLLSRGVTEIHPFYIAYAVAVIFSRIWVKQLCVLLTPQRLAEYILLIFIVCMIVTAYFSNVWALILNGIAVGAGYGLAFPALATIVGANVEPANRATAFGFFTMAVDLGFAIGAIGMGLVSDMWGYQTIFYVAGLYTLLYMVLYHFSFYGKLAKEFDESK
jgi:MFS family permease